MQMAPGNLYTARGELSAPAARNSFSATASSSAVEIPGRTAARNLASTAATMAPMCFRPSKSCGDSMDMAVSVQRLLYPEARSYGGPGNLNDDCSRASSKAGAFLLKET